jgi:putative oxidoreductase
MLTTTHPGPSVRAIDLFSRARERYQPVRRALEALAPAADLLVRLWVAQVFFQSGLTKLQSWQVTVQLFTYEYQVPYLAPETAAFLGTAAELVLPVFLALGLAGRAAAAALFVFNIVAVISYPALNAAGIHEHQLWGLMLLIPLLHGPGKLSLDYAIERWLKR